MREYIVSVAWSKTLAGRILTSRWCCALFVIAASSGIFSATARADAISNAVLNYPGGKWAAFYFPSDIAGFNPSTSPSLIMNDAPPSKGIEVDDPVGGRYIDDSSLNLEIDLSSGLPTGGHLNLGTGDEFFDGTNVLTVTPATVFSSATILGFGQIPNTTGVNYWFAFQNGSNPNNLIGGLIDSGDVKLFATSVPEPSSAVLLALAGIAIVSRRRSR